MTTFTNHQDFQCVFMNQANYYGEKNMHGKGNFSTVFMSLSQPSHFNLNLNNVCQSQEKQFCFFRIAEMTATVSSFEVTS